MPRLIIAFLVSEIAYVASARLLVRNFDGPLIHLELWWTLLRFVSAIVLAFLFLRPGDAHPTKPARIPARGAIALGMLLAPLLVGNAGLQGMERFLFAATSLVVGLREELAYRGILQRFLTPRLGLAASLSVSNLAFVAYHWGVHPFTPHYVLQVFLCGMILGVVYHLSGSIALVIGLHAAYDAIDSFSPYFAPRFPDFVCTVVLSLTLGMLLLRGRTRAPTAPRVPCQRPTDKAG